METSDSHHGGYYRPQLLTSSEVELMETVLAVHSGLGLVRLLLTSSEVELMETQIPHHQCTPFPALLTSSEVELMET